MESPLYIKPIKNCDDILNINDPLLAYLNEWNL